MMREEKTGTPAGCGLSSPEREGHSLQVTRHGAERDRSGRTPLHYAALEDDAARVAALIAEGADADAADDEGFTPLHMACQQGSLAAARSLLYGGARVDPVNVFGNTPLFVAVFYSRGRGDLIKLLRTWGADPFAVNRSGQTPVGLARLIGNFDVAQYFVDLPDG
jgi:ankyrin repeat protein